MSRFVKSDENTDSAAGLLQPGQPYPSPVPRALDPLNLSQVFAAAPALIAIHEGPDHHYVYANALYDKAVGGRPLIGRSLREALPELEGQDIFEQFDRVYETGKPIEQPQFRAVINAGAGGKPLSRWYRQILQPRLDETGETVGVITFAYDVTEEVEALQGAQTTRDALRASNERFGAAIEAVSGILWTNSTEGEMQGEQPGWAEITGQSFEEYQGFGWADAVHPDDAQATIDAWNEAVRERKMFVFEHRVRGADGDYRLYAVRAIPLFEATGEIREWVGVHTDVTDRRRDEEQLQLLNRELNHRVKNLFAVMQSLIRLSADGEADVLSFVEKLRARIDALAAAHLISTDEEELRPLPLGEIVRAILLPYEKAQEGRLRMEGEIVRLPRKTITPFSLILHELATNAVKYGAWSIPEGSLDINWQRSVAPQEGGPPVLELRWHENISTRNDKAAERKNGFGTKLIEASIAQLGGTIQRQWGDGSLSVTIKCPLEEET